MPNFDEKTLSYLENLARIDLDESEEVEFLEKLSNVLNYVDRLKEVPTEGVEPCVHVVPSHVAPLRNDEPKDQIPRQDLLRNAPEHTGGMIKVSKVLKDSE